MYNIMHFLYRLFIHKTTIKNISEQQIVFTIIIINKYIEET